MRFLLATSVLLLGLTAHAQSTSPALRGLGGHLSLHGRIEASGETSCSQSWATSRDSIDLSLDVAAGGAVTLRAESLTQRTFGDAATRYTGGAGTLTQTLSRRILSGHATRSARGVDIQLDHAEDAMMRWSGPGIGTLPAATTPSAIALAMHCALVDSAVLPATESTPEHPSTLSLLRCVFDAPPAFIEYDETNELLFGRGRGVRVVSERGGWDPRGSTAIRLAE